MATLRDATTVADCSCGLPASYRLDMVTSTRPRGRHRPVASYRFMCLECAEREDARGHLVDGSVVRLA